MPKLSDCEYKSFQKYNAVLQDVSLVHIGFG